MAHPTTYPLRRQEEMATQKQKTQNGWTKKSKETKKTKKPGVATTPETGAALWHNHVEDMLHPSPKALLKAMDALEIEVKTLQDSLVSAGEEINISLYHERIRRGIKTHLDTLEKRAGELMTAESLTKNEEILPSSIECKENFLSSLYPGWSIRKGRDKKLLFNFPVAPFNLDDRGLSVEFRGLWILISMKMCLLAPTLGFFLTFDIVGSGNLPSTALLEGQEPDGIVGDRMQYQFLRRQYHPHILDGGFCLGEGYTAVERARQHGDVISLYSVLVSLLHTLHRGGEYRQLFHYTDEEGGHCSVCGVWLSKSGSPEFSLCSTCQGVVCKKHSLQPSEEIQKMIKEMSPDKVNSEIRQRRVKEAMKLSEKRNTVCSKLRCGRKITLRMNSSIFASEGTVRGLITAPVCKTCVTLNRVLHQSSPLLSPPSSGGEAHSQGRTCSWCGEPVCDEHTVRCMHTHSSGGESDAVSSYFCGRCILKCHACGANACLSHFVPDKGLCRGCIERGYSPAPAGEVEDALKRAVEIEKRKEKK